MFFKQLGNFIKNNKILAFKRASLFVFGTTSFIYVNSYNRPIYLKYLTFTRSPEISKVIKNNKYDWEEISKDESSEAIQLCSKNLEEVYWSRFSCHESNEAVQLCIDNMDWTCLYSFSTNKSEKAIQFLIDNPNYIDWYAFVSNESDKAVDFCINNPKKINLYVFSQNNSEKARQYCDDNRKEVTDAIKFAREWSMMGNF